MTRCRRMLLKKSRGILLQFNSNDNENMNATVIQDYIFLPVFALHTCESFLFGLRTKHGNSVVIIKFCEMKSFRISFYAFY